MRDMSAFTGEDFRFKERLGNPLSVCAQFQQCSLFTWDAVWPCHS